MKPSVSGRNASAWLLCLALFGAGVGAGGNGTRQSDSRILVSAAASLTDALGEVAREYERIAGQGVDLNFGSSSGLARQILAGAPVDVFVSADAVQMDRVDRADGLVDGTRADILSNQLVVVTPATGPSLERIGDLQREAVRRVAIADPTAVPAGVYARGYLERLGLWAALEPKLVPAANVRAVLAIVDSGDVDAGFVYRTDAAIATRARVAFAVPIDETRPIRYPIAIVRGTRRPEAARQFVAFVRGPEASAIFQRLGFIVVRDGPGSKPPGNASRMEPGA